MATSFIMFVLTSQQMDYETRKSNKDIADIEKAEKILERERERERERDLADGHFSFVCLFVWCFAVIIIAASLKVMELESFL